MKKYKKQPASKSTTETLDLIFKDPIRMKPQKKGNKKKKIDIDDIDTTTEASIQNGNDED